MKFRKETIISALVILVTFTLNPGAGLCDDPITPVMECTLDAFEALGLTDEKFNLPVEIFDVQLVPATATVPEHCSVEGNIWPEVGVHIKFPVSNWNQRYYMTGCGGSAGTFYDSSMLSYVAKGFASGGTNMGHDAAINPGYSFAYDPGDGSNDFADQKFEDFSYRALHETAVLAKQMIQAYYGVEPSYFYYSGGSCGGRAGLMQAQRYPEDYDGLLVTMPVIYLTRSHFVQLWDRRTMEPPGNIEEAKIQLIADAVYARCDGLDGIVDGLIDDPRECPFDPRTELPACPDDIDGPDCFTTAQRETVFNVYDGPRNAAGESLSFGVGMTKGSSIFRPYGSGKRSLWLPYVINPPVQFFDTAFKYMYPRPPYGPFGPTWDWRTDFDFDAEPSEIMAGVEEILNASDPDLSLLKQRGSKMIMLHGWSDTLVPSIQSPAYYEDVLATMGADETKEFYKLYMIPGYGHGSGFGTSSADFDKAVRDWVEDGIDPGAIIGTRAASPVMGTPERTRPLCPYPEVARYSGDGSIEDAANFMCVPPVKVRIKPEVLNLKSKGKFTAFITIPEDYDVRDWGIDNLTCEGAAAINGKVSKDGRTYIAKFNRQDLVDVEPGEAVTMTVKGIFQKNGMQALLIGYDEIIVKQHKSRKGKLKQHKAKKQKR